MILTMGNPFGFDQTVTSGMISSRNRTLKIENVVYENLIQTDSPINRGSSGGPLVNVKGEVIGINTAIFAPTGVFNGIGFAIPINRAAELVGGVIDFNNTAPDVGTGQLAAWARCGRQVGNSFKLPDGQIITPPHPFKGNCIDCHPQLAGQAGPGNGQGPGQGLGRGLGQGLGRGNGLNNPAPANQVGLRNGTGPGCLPVAGTPATTEPYLGIELVEVNSIIARQFNMVQPEGVLVNNVHAGGPAETSGLQRGDVIIRVAGRKIQNSNDLNQILAGQKIGSKVELVVLRNGSRQTVKVKTGTAPPSMTDQAPPARQTAEFEWMGGEMTPLSPALTPYLKYGVYVAESGGILLQSGLKTGDVIVGIDGKQVADMNGFIPLTKAVNAKRGFILDVIRAGNPLYITVKV
jgi:S1-C subfamily serine protease